MVVKNAFLCCKYRIKIQETTELPSYYNIKRRIAFVLLIRMFYLCTNYILNDLQYVYRIILCAAL